MAKFLSFLIAFVFISASSFTQNFKFAFLSDVHIGIKNAAEDLRRTVEDINADTALKFVIITGDISELGTDEEYQVAKSIFSKLKKPLYVQTGNHDTNWSPTGGRAFNSVFGAGRFCFQYGGYLFIGTNAGPEMHHKAPGQVPREDIIWLDSIINNLMDNGIPIVYTNHFPQDSTQRNWYEAVDRLKKRNLQLFLVGHLHINKQGFFEGVPFIMGRTNTRGADTIGGYNIVTFKNGKVTSEERRPLSQTLNKWAEAEMYDHEFSKDTLHYPRPSYAINNMYPAVRMLWQVKDDHAIGAGAVVRDDIVVATNTGGLVYALNVKDGKKKWSFQTGGKIFSTPVVASDYLVVASTDSSLYCLNTSNGTMKWKYKSTIPVVASPAIDNNVIFIGGSGGHFKAIDLVTGKVKWDFGEVEDFVFTKPLIYNNTVYFGSWGSEFYALDASNGHLRWKWTDTSHNRMFSPAGCRPVATGGKVFIVAPDGAMTAFNAATGGLIWRTKMPAVKVRESMGLSADSAVVYVKTTEGKLYGISTTETGMKAVFNVNLQLGYDICAAPIEESKGVIYIPSNAGIACAAEKQSGKLLWKHKVSNSNITSILPFEGDKVIVTTIDGKISCLQILEAQNQKGF
jgi:outer membrane protein assembly factor BamB/predicted phosphodiesterase